VNSSTESHASRAFALAEENLHALDFADRRLRPPLDFVVAGAPAPRSGETSPFALTRVEPAPPATLPGRTIRQTVDALREGSTSTRELVEEALKRSEEFSELGAVVSCDAEASLAMAVQLDHERTRGRSRGPLHGVPVTVKDIIDVDGLPTRGGSLAYYEMPTGDAAAVANLRRDGALILAKVATHEFALGVTTPQCRNPHDEGRISGGSSGGSAIAVAVGIGVGSLGTDTRASLRVPAALCGVVGFKPTFGRVPTDGIIPLSWTIDHLGPISRTVEDSAILLNSLAARPFLDTSCARAPGVIGVVPDVLADADPSVVAACAGALGALEDLGWRIVTVGEPGIEDLELSNSLGLLISRSEAAAYHRGRGTDLAKCIPEVRDQLSGALNISATDYLDSQRHRESLARRTLQSFVHCDIVVSPTSPVVAPSLGDYERYLLRLSRNTIIWSLVGAPAVSIPVGRGEGGMPVGLQLAAAPGHEQVLVDAGIALERALAEIP
jgi:aspartyl-tRNA(Asn)/glutamyl-tRNA(Gln) amidotransferase subunit A